LDQIIAVADAFLERGEIMTTRARKLNETQRFNARPGDLTNGKALVLLINGETSSGAEMLAAALQDHGRATLIGTQSIGKGGTVQTIIPLGSSNGALRLTTARHLSPSGRNLTAAGIRPDIVVEQARVRAGESSEMAANVVPDRKTEDLQLQSALAFLRQRRN
jgi:carboxyl-terminal processing protease